MFILTLITTILLGLLTTWFIMVLASQWKDNKEDWQLWVFIVVPLIILALSFTVHIIQLFSY